MKKIKIAHVIHLDGDGGGPKVLVEHLRHQKERYEVVLLHGGDGEATAFCKENGIPHYQVSLETLSKSVIGWWQLWWRLRCLKPDLLILHGQWAGPLGALAGRCVGGIKMIYICHWPAFFTDWDLKRIIRNYLVEKIPCTLVDRVVTLSPSGRYHYLLRRLVDEKRLRMIPNPFSFSTIPTAETVKKLREQYQWTSDHWHVVTVARLSSQKCLHWLLESWVEVSRAIPQARLWIVGRGEEEAQLKALAKELKIEETCCFLGAYPRGSDFLAASDVVAMTTMYEAQGMVALEAMACGKVVVSNRVAGVEDTIEHDVHGYLAPVGDTHAFANYLIDLWRHPEKRKEMEARARQRVNDFAAETILAQYDALYAELFEKGADR